MPSGRVFLLRKGDVLVMPSGTYHYVYTVRTKVAIAGDFISPIAHRLGAARGMPAGRSSAGRHLSVLPPSGSAPRHVNEPDRAPSWPSRLGLASECASLIVRAAGGDGVAASRGARVTALGRRVIGEEIEITVN